MAHFKKQEKIIVMINKIIFSIGLLFWSTSIYCQIIDTEKKSRQEISEYEIKQNGVLTDTIISFGILKSPHNDLNTLEQTRVYIFKRQNDDFDPQLHVWYHFDPEIEEIKGIKYYWGLYNPKFNPSQNKELLEKLTKKEKEFNKKYNSLKKELEKRFGKPIKSKVISDNEISFIENVFWEDTEKIVGISIKFNRQLKEIPGVGVIGDFKVEVMITYK